MGVLSSKFLQPRLNLHAEDIEKNCGMQTDCAETIDKTVVGVARPGGSKMQNAVRNVHKRKQALKIKAINSTDDMARHGFGLLE